MFCGTFDKKDLENDLREILFQLDKLDDDITIYVEHFHCSNIHRSKAELRKTSSKNAGLSVDYKVKEYRVR